FAVLTYVWGGIEQPKLKEANMDEYSCDYGLDAIWRDIPKTIRDAIHVCETIGERYLWVDALCIVQDSPRDVKTQILRMREIYSAAKFTIAAVSA
ncbi:heterokaryon incompatibility, partial [Colletotrichum godetiae]